MRFRNADLAVGQGRATDCGQGCISDQQPVPNAQAIADGGKGLTFALLGTLSVTDVYGGSVVIAGRQRGADAGIHPATEENNRAAFSSAVYRFDHSLIR